MFSDQNKVRESDVITFLETTAKNIGVTSPMVIVVNRTSQSLSLTRKVRFVVVVPTNSETVVDGLIKASLYETNSVVSFSGSEVNLDNGDLSMDYLYFDANIIAKQN